MPTGQPSQADLELLAAATAAGITMRDKPITMSQLQTWRRRGLVPDVIVSSSGRRGRTSTYPPDALERFRSATGLMTALRNVNAAVLCSFGRGNSIPECSLRLAYRWLIDRQKVAVEKIDQAFDDRKTASRYAMDIDNWFRRRLGQAHAYHHQALKQVAMHGLVNSSGNLEKLSTAQLRQQILGEVNSSLAGKVDEWVALSATLAQMSHLMLRVDREAAMGAFAQVPVRTTDDQQGAIQRASYEELILTRDALGILFEMLEPIRTLFGEETCDICDGILIAGMIPHNVNQKPGRNRASIEAVRSDLPAIQEELRDHLKLGFLSALGAEFVVDD